MGISVKRGAAGDEQRAQRAKMILSLSHLPVFRIALKVGCSEWVVRHVLYDHGLRAAVEVQPEPEPDKPPPVLATNLSPAMLERARRILGQTGDINLAAQQVGMSPTRLQRHINNLR